MIIMKGIISKSGGNTTQTSQFIDCANAHALPPKQKLTLRLPKHKQKMTAPLPSEEPLAECPFET
jgi:hypothetical protein